LSISFFAMRILQYLAEQETGASLGLQIDLPDILADDPQGEEDQPADGPHRADHAGPADDGGSRGPTDDRVDQHEDADGKDEEAQAGNVADGLDGQGGDALHGEGEHLFQGVFALAGEPLPPLVLHGASGIGDEDIKKAISLGIAKINIHTELCQAAMEAINAHKDEPFLAVEREVRKAVKERAMYKIKLFGDDGRADE